MVPKKYLSETLDVQYPVSGLVPERKMQDANLTVALKQVAASYRTCLTFDHPQLIDQASLLSFQIICQRASG